MYTRISTYPKAIRHRFISVRSYNFREIIAGKSNEVLACAVLRDYRRWHGEAHIKAETYVAREIRRVKGTRQ
jgi:hypothetical protein